MAKWLGVLTALVCLAGVPSARAQSFPSRPVTIFVTAAPGGVSDVVARAVGQKLSERWGKQVIIENRGGGGHNIAGAAVAKAAPDGHTLLVAEAGLLVVNPALYGKDKLTYDAETDLMPITGLIRINQALIINPSLPAASVRELLDLARQKPRTITYATAGVGSAPHLNFAMLEHLAGAQLVPVHYRGAALAMNDVIAGHVNAMIVSIGSALPPTQAGQVNMLGVGSRKRLPLFPDVPTLAEDCGLSVLRRRHLVRSPGGHRNAARDRHANQCRGSESRDRSRLPRKILGPANVRADHELARGVRRIHQDRVEEMVRADPRREAEHRVADTRSALASSLIFGFWEQTQPSSRASCPGPISALAPSVNVGARRAVELNRGAGVCCAMGPGHEARDDTCGGRSPR
jgi:tripartite-type tricarboxylate transporter receptor subunit TctC